MTTIDAQGSNGASPFRRGWAKLTSILPVLTLLAGCVGYARPYYPAYGGHVYYGGPRPVPVPVAPPAYRPPVVVYPGYPAYRPHGHFGHRDRPREHERRGGGRGRRDYYAPPHGFGGQGGSGRHGGREYGERGRHGHNRER